MNPDDTVFYRHLAEHAPANRISCQETDASCVSIHDQAIDAANFLASEQAILIDISPGDATRYRFALVRLPRTSWERTPDTMLALIDQRPGGSAALLSSVDLDAGDIHWSYLRDKLGVGEHTAHVLSAFIAEYGAAFAAAP